MPVSFRSLGVPEPICLALDAMAYAEPTDVQVRALPVLLSGKDVLVEARTGSGKTAVFGIVSVIAGSGPQRGLRALVLVPTRELARQVADEVRAIGTGSSFRAVAVTGGVQEEQEDRALGGDVRCVIATPGRLLSLIEHGKVHVEGVKLVVLDEADRMLDMGFLTDVEKVLSLTAARTQTVLVSATLPRDVQKLASVHLRQDREHIRVGTAAIPASLDHYRLNVLDGQKEAAIVALLKKEDPSRALVFVRTRDRADAFWRLLKGEGFAVDRLQGEMSHDQRRHVFDLFSRGTTSILVATDIASRGLDVPEMELVVNVDLPDEDEQYLHRAGRAARQDRPGKVVTLVSPNEKERRIQLERISHEWAPYRLDIPKQAPPATSNDAGKTETRQGPKAGSSSLGKPTGKDKRNDAGRRGSSR
ncbi:MAG: DEAD/DEAH box helicase [Candidatus Thermoplasmatota archaeon]